MQTRWQRRTRRRPGYEPPELIARPDYSIVASIAVIAVTIVWIAQARLPTHAVYVDIPVRGMFDNSQAWRSVPNEPVHLVSPKANGVIEWDGEPVTPNELLGHLQHGLMQPVEPLIVFHPEAYASYDLAAHVINLIRQSGVSKFCFAGLEEHQHFEVDAPSLYLRTSMLLPEVVPSEPIQPAPYPPACSVPSGPFTFD